MALLKSIPTEVIDMMKKLHIIVSGSRFNCVSLYQAFAAALSVILGALCVTLGIIFSAPIAYKAKGDCCCIKSSYRCTKGRIS